MARLTGIRTELCHKPYQPSLNSWRNCPQKLDHPGPCGDPPPTAEDEHTQRMIRASLALEPLLEALFELQDEERIEVIREILDKYCHLCGEEIAGPFGCQCTNDE